MKNEVYCKIISWNGNDIDSFANSFSTDDLIDIECWSENHAFGSVGEWDFEDATQLSADEKHYIIKGLITDLLMGSVQGQFFDDEHNQKELVTHFFHLWMSMNGDVNECH